MRLASLAELVPSDALETTLETNQLSVARLERMPNANHRIQNGRDCAFDEKEGFVRLRILDLQFFLSSFFKLTQAALQCAV